MTAEEKRDLVVRLAERVMGAEPITEAEGRNPGWRIMRLACGHIWQVSPNGQMFGWNPLYNIADAFMLVEALNRKFWMFSIGQVFESSIAAFDAPVNYVVTGHRYEKHGGEFYDGKGSVQEYASALPLAICLAADAAVRDAGAEVG